MKQLSFSLLCFAVAGCGEPKPDGLPPLASCKITITQEGVPFAGAMVTLVPDDSALSRWVCGGITDSSGVCVVRTYGKFAGAPLGKFKVVLSKTEEIQGETAKLPMPEDGAKLEAYYKKIAAETKYFDLVDVKYQQAGTTDLTVEVGAGGAVQTFDIGKAVRREFRPAAL